MTIGSPLMREAPMCLRIARLEQDILDGDKIAVVYASDLRALIAEYERLSSRRLPKIDPRDPDPIGCLGWEFEDER